MLEDPSGPFFLSYTFFLINCELGNYHTFTIKYVILYENNIKGSSMEVIQIGSLAILPKWVLLGGAIILGLIFTKIWLKGSQSKKVFDILSNSVFLGFFIWKGSIILFNPVLVWKSPFSLLYFSGGSDGLIIAIICSGLYFILKSRKERLSNLLAVQTIFIFSFVVLALYHIAFTVFLELDVIFHLLVGTFSIVILVLSLMKSNILLLKGMISATILFSFIYLIFSFIFIETNNRLLIFTLEQWFFIGLIIFSLLMDKGSKQSKE